MKKVRILDRQNVIDLSIQYYGSLEGLPILCEDNGFKPDDSVDKGTEIIIQDDKVIDKTVLNILNRDDLIVATGQFPTTGNFVITEDNDFWVDENENYVIHE